MDEETTPVRPALLWGWIGALVVVIAGFTALGGGALEAPALSAPASWGAWADGRDAVVATAAVLRLVVLALAWYLLGTTLVGALARVARWGALVRMADLLSVPAVRRVLQASVGAGLAATVVVSSGAGPVPGPAGPTMTVAAGQSSSAGLDVLPPPHVAPVPRAPADAPPTDPADPTPAVDPPGARPAPTDSAPADAPPSEPSDPTGAPDLAPPTTPTDAPPSNPDAPPSEAPEAREAPEAADDLVTVAPGDHLWAIAERHVAAVRGAGVSDAEVAAYWAGLVEANRGRLVDPDDPDLVLPGQRFVLPALDEAGAS